MDKKLNLKKLWWLISIIIAVMACRSNTPAVDEKKQGTEVTEHPRPVSDPNLDSLKNVLEEKRRQRNK
jgi:hypothetical protein